VVSDLHDRSAAILRVLFTESRIVGWDTIKFRALSLNPPVKFEGRGSGPILISLRSSGYIFQSAGKWGITVDGANALREYDATRGER